MSNKMLVQVSLLSMGILLGAFFQPLSWLPASAQGDCRAFPETGKQVCGRFLQYWTGAGGLAQQGLPISNEFTEVSDLNGQSYTVQYFERAVFEKHPENAAPFDVLLSQLGTFQFARKYPNGEPGGSTPPPPPPTGGDIFNASGDGQTKTNLFNTSGSIKIDWTAQDTGTSSVGCFHGVSMKSGDAGNSFFDLVANMVIDGGASKTGTTNEYNLKAGNYYFDVNSGCQWSIRVYR